MKRAALVKWLGERAKRAGHEREYRHRLMEAARLLEQDGAEVERLTKERDNYRTQVQGREALASIGIDTEATLLEFSKDLCAKNFALKERAEKAESERDAAVEALRILHEQVLTPPNASPEGST